MPQPQPGRPLSAADVDAEQPAPGPSAYILAARVKAKHTTWQKTTHDIPKCVRILRSRGTAGDSQHWHGIAIDTGAERYCIGLSQARAYCRIVGITMNLRPSNQTFVFGDQRCESLGTLQILLPTPAGLLRIPLDVVPLNISALLGLDFLYKYKLEYRNVEDVLYSVEGDWSQPVTRQLGHAYVTWDNVVSNFYSKAQLQRLNRHLYHPSVGKMFALLRRA
jgi:hypothetical protein